MPGEAESRLIKHHPVKPTHYPGQWEQGTDDKPEQGEHCSPGTKHLPTRNATVGVKLGETVHWGLATSTAHHGVTDPSVTT